MSESTPNPPQSETSTASTPKKLTKGEKREKRTRNTIERKFPYIKDYCWDLKKYDGWLPIPRTMPSILLLLDCLKDKGKPLDKVYLELWCTTFNTSLATTEPERCARLSGYTGQRAKKTWEDRMDKLIELKFIACSEGASGKYHYTYIFNPFLVAGYHRKKKTIGLQKNAYDEFVSMVEEYGADFPSEKQIAEFEKSMDTFNKI